MKKLFVSSLFVNVLVMIFHFSTGILAARYLGPEGRGELAVVVRWSSLFGLLLSFGMPGAVTFLGKQFPGKQREFVGAYLVAGVVIGLVGVCFGIWLLPVFLSSQSQEVIWLVCFSILGLPTMLLADGLIGTLSTLNMFRKVIFLRFFSPLGTLMIVLLLVVFGQYSVSSFIYFNFLWGLLFFCLITVLVVTSCRPSFNFLAQRSRELFRKGKQIYIPNLVTLFGDNLDQIVISLFLVPAVLGYYAVAGSIGSILPSVIVGTLGVFLLPKLMELKGPERQTTVGRIHGCMLYGSLVLTAFAAMALPFMLPFLYGQQYASAVIMGIILLSSTPFRIAYTVLTNYVSSEDRFKFVTEAEVFGLVVGTGLTLLLLPMYGGSGAAIGVAASSFIKWVWMVRRCLQLGMSFSELIKLDAGYMFAVTKGLALKSHKKNLPHSA